MCPIRRVLDDVLADSIQFFFVANDVFVIISLPQRRPCGITQFVDAFGGLVFEISNDLPQRRFVGAGSPRPYVFGDEYKRVQVIWHHHKFFQHNILEMVGDLFPIFVNDFASTR